MAAGRFGGGASTKGVTPDIISFACAKGAFVGVSLEGAVVKMRDKLNNVHSGESFD